MEGEDKSIIMRIVVMGAWTSGRHTFLSTISDNQILQKDYALQLDWKYEAASLIYDFAELEISTPKRLTLGHYNNTQIEEVIGFVGLIDSSNPVTFREAKSLVDTLVHYSPTAYIIAANKQDLEDAWSVEDLRIILRVPPEILIVPCVATEKKSVANVLIGLCEEVLRLWEKEAET